MRVLLKWRRPAMRARKKKRLVSYALIAGGAFLLFQGAREFLESRWGQSSAAREFEEQEIGPRDPAPTGQSPSGEARPQTPSSEVRPRTGDTFAKLMIPRLD